MIDLEAMRFELRRDCKVHLTVVDDASGVPLVSGAFLSGRPIIGVGRMLDIRGITEGEAVFLLNNDILQYLQQLSLVPWFETIDSRRQRAVIHMRHTMGMAGFLSSHDLLAALEAHDWPEAVAAARRSAWYDASDGAERVLALLA